MCTHSFTKYSSSCMVWKLPPPTHTFIPPRSWWWTLVRPGLQTDVLPVIVGNENMYTHSKMQSAFSPTLCTQVGKKQLVSDITMYMCKEEVVEIVRDMGDFENQGWDTVLHVYVGLVQAPLITRISMQDSSNKRTNHVWEGVTCTDPVCDNEWIGKLHSHSRFTSTATAETQHKNIQWKRFPYQFK